MKPELELPGKKGLCLTLRVENDDDPHVAIFKALAPSWNYNWNVRCHARQPENIEFLPQVWGGAKNLSVMKDRLEEHIVPLIESGQCKRILCFNEPDKKEQSNMKVEDCIKFWPLFQELGVPLCSPSCANPLGEAAGSDACQGVSGSWMRDFMCQIDKHGYRIDYIGVHWYGGSRPATFQDKMRVIHQAYKKPLLITEFAVADWKVVNKSPDDNRHSQQQVLAFMKKILPWIQKTPWIAGYAWYSFRVDEPQGTSSALFDANGDLTACGRYYQSVTTDNPNGDQSITVE